MRFLDCVSLVLTVGIIASLVQSQEIKYKVCASLASYDDCQQVSRGQKIACRTNLHSVDCLLNIQNGRSHLGRIFSEEAALGAGLLNEDVVVIGEVSSSHSPPETVVVVKNDVPSNIADLRGKKLCHPGYNHDDRFSTLFLQELEQKVIELDEDYCPVSQNTTLLEQHIKALAEFFGDSCRPGAWTQDDTLDGILKSRYPSLCSLCGERKCDVGYLAPFKDSLECLANNGADIAVTTLWEAQKFFNRSNESIQKYKYLCKDGTSKSLSSPCVWSRQVPSLIVAQRNAAGAMRDYLIETQPTQGGSALQESLAKVLKLRSKDNITILSEYKSLTDYVKERRSIPALADSRRCDISLRWCTRSDQEQEKCRWLSQAALNKAIQPVVECVRSEDDDELSCLNDVEKDKADIVVASADYAYVSLSKNLVALAYPETDTRNLSKILAVKKVHDESIAGFRDLRGKKACIPEYGGKEFLAFIDAGRQLNVIENNNCNYGKVFSDFVDVSCVPGVLSRERKVSEETNGEKLCELCAPINRTATARYCNADVINKYYGSEGAIRCLNDEIADFAVVTKKDFGENTQNLQVICKNGELAPTPGLDDIPSDCALNIITSSELVARNDNKRNADIVLALREFERWFGQDGNKPFHLFNVFNGTLDLLFKDSTPGIDFNGDQNPYIQNYRKLLANTKSCISEPSGAIHYTSSIVFVVFSAIVFLV